MRNLRFVLSLLVLGVLVAFFVPVRDGRPFLTLAAVKDRVAAFRAPEGAAGGSEGRSTMYKWKDADGTWHYGNVKPADHPEAQPVRGGDVSWAKGSGGTAPSAGSGERAAPRNAKELLEESKRLREQSETRESDLEKLAREAGSE